MHTLLWVLVVLLAAVTAAVAVAWRSKQTEKEAVKIFGPNTEVRCAASITSCHQFVLNPCVASIVYSSCL